MPLELIETAKAGKPPRLLIYGPGGIGKSSLAAAMPNPVFINIEDRLGHIDATALPRPQTFSDVMQQLESLAEEEHDFNTVVIDSADWLEQLIHEHVAKEARQSSIAEIAYGKGYDMARLDWRDVLRCLDWLATEHGMMPVIIAHETMQRYDDPEHEPYDRYEPALHKKSGPLLKEWADGVLFATYKRSTKTTDEGFGKQRTRALSTGERIVRTEERPFQVAKNSWQMPYELPLDWPTIAGYIWPADKKETE